MGIRPVIFLVMYRPKVQVGLQLTVRAFDFTGEIVIVPCGLLVKIGHVRPQEINAALSVHVLRHCDAPMYVRHVPWVLRVIRYVVDGIVLGDGRVFLPCSSDTLNDLLVALRAVFLREGVFRLLEFLLEAFLEFAVHRLLLEFLGWGVYLKIVVSVLLVLHLCELDGLLFAVEHRDGFGIRGELVVRKPSTADAQVGVSFLLYPQEVVFCGYSSVKAYEHLVLWVVRHACLRMQSIHHVWQGVRVCCVASKNGGVAYEALLVDAKSQHEKLAVAAFFLGTTELGLLTVVLAALEVEIGQVEDGYPVRYVEKIVRLPAEMALEFVFQPIQGRRHLVYGLKSRTPLLVAADELAYGRVLLHDAHGLQFRRRINGTRDKMCQRGAYLYLAPAFILEEPVYPKLADGLKAHPFGTYLPGVGMLDGVHVHKTLCLLARLLQRGLHSINAAVFNHLMPELLCLPLHEVIVPAQRVAEQVFLPLMLMNIGKALADVADVLRAVWFVDESYIQHDTATNAACQVAERLLDAVVPVIVLSPRVVSGLGHKVHCVCKNTTFSRNPCVLQFKIEGCVC